jgi:hypothetical protein
MANSSLVMMIGDEGLSREVDIVRANSLETRLSIVVGGIPHRLTERMVIRKQEDNGVLVW